MPQSGCLFSMEAFVGEQEITMVNRGILEDCAPPQSRL